MSEAVLQFVELVRRALRKDEQEYAFGYCAHCQMPILHLRSAEDRDAIYIRLRAESNPGPHLGMLWYDHSDQDIWLKVHQAVEHFIRKHGRRPLKVLLPRGTLGMATHKPASLDWLPAEERQYVLPCHLILVMEEVQYETGEP